MKDKLYKAVIVLGTMYVDEIEAVRNEADACEIYASAHNDNPVIIDGDLNRLEAMADQMGLAFVTQAT